MRRAEAPRQNSCATVASTKATRQNMSSEGMLSAAFVNATSATSAANVNASGATTTRLSPDSVTRRQANMGPMPDSSTSTSASGTVSRSNQGGPTLAFSPVSASEISGKKVPHMITRARPTRTRLLSRKNDSRESSESSRASERRSGRRDSTSATEKATTIPMNTRNWVPIVEAPKAWIESRMPERTRKVPINANKKEQHT